MARDTLYVARNALWLSATAGIGASCLGVTAGIRF